MVKTKKLSLSTSCKNGVKGVIVNNGKTLIYAQVLIFVVNETQIFFIMCYVLCMNVYVIYFSVKR
jgi:hypothetical protein